MKHIFVCQSVGVLVLGAIVLSVSGNGLAFLPHFKFFWSEPKLLVTIYVPMLAMTLRMGAFALFVLAFIKQLKSTVVHRELCAIAGYCVLLSVVLLAISIRMNIRNMYGFQGFNRFVFYMCLYGINMILGILLAIFFFHNRQDKLPSKGLAAVVLALMLIMLGYAIVNNVMFFTEYPYEQIENNILGFIGHSINTLGWVIYQIATVVFMIAFLTIRRPQMEIVDDGSRTDYY